MADETNQVEEYESEEEEDESPEGEHRRAPRPTGRPQRAAPRDNRRGGPRGRRFRPRRKVCSFCVDKVKDINYKDVETIRRFIDGHGKIIPRRKTGTCAKHQRRLALAIKRARHLALLPFAAGRTPYE